MDVRITNNDPNFERIQGKRKARALKFNAKILFWIGVVTLLLCGIGLIFWIIALIINIKANKLLYKYQE